MWKKLIETISGRVLSYLIIGLIGGLFTLLVVFVQTNFASPEYVNQKITEVSDKNHEENREIKMSQLQYQKDNVDNFKAISDNLVEFKQGFVLLNEQVFTINKTLEELKQDTKQDGKEIKERLRKVEVQVSNP